MPTQRLERLEHTPLRRRERLQHLGAPSSRASAAAPDPSRLLAKEPEDGSPLVYCRDLARALAHRRDGVGVGASGEEGSDTLLPAPP